MPAQRHPVVLGGVRFRSAPLSTVWTLETPTAIVARFQRYPSLHLSRGVIESDPVEIRPQGWGTVVVYQGDHELGRIVRRSWLGRRWEVAGQSFAAELVSEPLPRRWTLRIGGHPIAAVAGTAWSYNRLRVHADVSVPVWALALVWHVVVRPWELAAEPRTMRPVPASPA